MLNEHFRNVSESMHKQADMLAHMLIPHAPLHHQTTGEVKSECQTTDQRKGRVNSELALEKEEEEKNRLNISECVCVSGI